jgi:hypothetical protein
VKWSLKRGGFWIQVVGHKDRWQLWSSQNDYGVHIQIDRVGGTSFCFVLTCTRCVCANSAVGGG